MKNQIFKTLFPRLILILLVGSIAFGTGGCKSKKKLAMEQAAKEYAEKVEKAKAELQAILDDDGTMPLTEKERRLADIKAMNLNDPAVNDLIAKVEAKIEAEKEALRKKEEEVELKRKQAEEEKHRYDYITDSFIELANASDVKTANAKITEALKLYSSESVPVLIIIHQEGDIVDYDKPTNIKDYLNYIKDQKKYNNSINSVKFDGYGQITELELIKN
jgi:hypothetical protein